MKFRGPIFFSFLLACLLFAAFYRPADDSEKEAVLIHSILDGVNRYHFAPKEVDDSFSQTLYDLYLDRIDGGHRWLTQADLKSLEVYKDKLDDEAIAGTYEYFDLSLQLIKQGIDKSQRYFEEILAKPFDFNADETYELDGKKRSFAKDDAELREIWRKMLKYETLTRLEEKLEAQAEGKDEELKGLSTEELEKKSREEVLKVYSDWYGRLARRDRTDYLNTYLNSVTNVFDPHTGYFEPIEKQNFDISLSGKLEGIGARLQSDGEFTKVSSIVVGGPAWKQGDLKENDKIIKVAQGDEEAVDVTGMDLDDVVSLIRGSKGTEVKLTVKKVDGTAEEITIIRDIVILEEGFAKSLLLHTTAKEKVGYIYLPRFYDDFSDENGRSCAEDVAKELEKLKAQKVGGVILDLRDNPGGSLRDVVTMSGLFIESGPIVQVKSRDRTPDVLKDVDPGVTYNGPLIIMVNTFSASASEIIAAAMQDYERAVIVGSPSTFGKGTVQRFIDLDRSVTGYYEIKPLGSVKLTIQKFYRIDGGSTQLRGVEPDIVLPDDFIYLDMGEKETEFPMKWTEIASVPHEQKVYKVQNLDQLKAQSSQRVKNNPVYQEILVNAKRLKDQRDNSVYPLNLDKYRTEQEQLQKKIDAYKKLFENDVVFGVENIPTDVDYLNAEEGRKARNEDWLKDVRKDVQLQETLLIMHDMLGK
ncbi:MAG: carboxy terminal-processing peptidase [Saprospirales bacterium]|nr:carboxy terminal-processing peptidase [Saprospirales bacterium]MBK8493019.1 carboxy terminal-processing peptidase [Saprospirales bacterium]